MFLKVLNIVDSENVFLEPLQKYISEIKLVIKLERSSKTSELSVHEVRFEAN